MTTSDDEQIVRAALAAPAQLPEEVIARLGDARVTALLAAATTLGFQRKFSTSPDRDRLREFTEVLHARFPDAAHLIKPIVIEAMARFAFGETDLIDGIDPEDLRTGLFVLPYAIISEEQIHGEPLDEFVAEVLAVVDAPE
jgi:hypothetical protein